MPRSACRRRRKRPAAVARTMRMKMTARTMEKTMARAAARTTEKTTARAAERMTEQTMAKAEERMMARAAAMAARPSLPARMRMIIPLSPLAARKTRIRKNLTGGGLLPPPAGMM